METCLNANKPIRSQRLRALLEQLSQPVSPPGVKLIHPGQSLEIVLHEDEWPVFELMDVPESHLTKTWNEDGWIQITIDPAWVGKFLVMARLWDWDNINRWHRFVYPESTD